MPQLFMPTHTPPREQGGAATAVAFQQCSGIVPESCPQVQAHPCASGLGGECNNGACQCLHLRGAFLLSHVLPANAFRFVNICPSQLSSDCCYFTGSQGEVSETIHELFKRGDSVFLNTSPIVFLSQTLRGLVSQV